jgi:hypothetical protein
VTAHGGDTNGTGIAEEEAVRVAAGDAAAVCGTTVGDDVGAAVGEAVAADVTVVGGADSVGGVATTGTTTGVGGSTGTGVMEGVAGTGAMEDEAAGGAAGDAEAGSAADATGDAGLMVVRTDAAATGANWWLTTSMKLGHEIVPRFCSIQRNQM